MKEEKEKYGKYIKDMKEEKDKYGKYIDISISGIIQRLRRIEPGDFMMGSTPDEPGSRKYERPGRNEDERQHHVTLTNSFWLADSACTQELWKAVMGHNPSQFKGKLHPVENVSWDDCIEFLDKLNKRSTNDFYGFCLPTEAEWEYACRAGTVTPFSFGRQIDTEQVNYRNVPIPYDDGTEHPGYRGKTVEVKSLPPNPWGLHEMHGNVYEWVSDRYEDYPIGSITDPSGSLGGRDRVRRGGCWFSEAKYVRSAFRFRDWPDNRVAGFRFSMKRRYY